MQIPRIPYARALIALATVAALLAAGVPMMRSWFAGDSQTGSRYPRPGPVGESESAAVAPDDIQGLVRTLHRSHDAAMGTSVEEETLTTWFGGENGNEWWLRHSAAISDSAHSSPAREQGAWAAEETSWEQFARATWHSAPCVEVGIAVPRLRGESMRDCLERLRDLENAVAVRYVPVPVDHVGHAPEQVPARIREVLTPRR